MMRSRAWVALAGALGIITLSYTILAPKNLPRLAQLKLKEETLKREIITTTNKIQELQQEAEDLSGDSKRSLKKIEQIARDEFGLVGKDEFLLYLENATD